VSAVPREWIDREHLARDCHANERRLNEIAAMTGLGREMHSAEIERLEAEQGRIEYVLGLDGPQGARRWSGMG
jgi:hypothetical protein